MNDSFPKVSWFLSDKKVQLYFFSQQTHIIHLSLMTNFCHMNPSPRNFLHVNKELKSFYILSITKKEKYATIYFAHVSLTSNSSSCQYYLQKITSCWNVSTLSNFAFPPVLDTYTFCIKLALSILNIKFLFFNRMLNICMLFWASVVLKSLRIFS